MSKLGTNNGKANKARTDKPRMSKRGYELLEGELPDLYEDLKRDYGDAIEEWLDEPHPHLLWRKPRDLLGTENEIHLRNLIRRIRFGIPT